MGLLLPITIITATHITCFCNISLLHINQNPIAEVSICLKSQVHVAKLKKNNNANNWKSITCYKVEHDSNKLLYNHNIIAIHIPQRCCP